MTQVVKTIKGRKYIYEVKWDSQQKKQVWTYKGKVEERIDPENLKKELYRTIMKRSKIQKKDRKKIMEAIGEVLDNYNSYW